MPSLKVYGRELELAPNDPMYLSILSLLYIKGGQLDKLAATLKQQFDHNPTPSHYIQVMNLALINGNPAQVEKDLLTLLKEFPHNEILLTLLMDAYMLQQKYDPAQESLEQIMLMNPDVEPMRSKMLDAINYLKENPIPTERLASLKGSYRSDGNERMMNFELFNKFLLRKTQHSSGYYLYPTSDISFLRSFATYINEYKPLVNEKNKVYGVLLHQTNLNGTTGDFYYWKQDSLIWRAEKLLKNRAYEQALPAYKAAITAYPEHYYLYKAKEHIEYMLSKPDSALQQLYQRYVGGYEGEWDIWIEDGQLFFKTPNIGRRILRPISDNEFIELIDYNGIYTMDVENGAVKGIYGSVYDKDARDWRRLENWYRARKKLKD